MTAQLWCFGESGNAYKAALTMELAGYGWRPVYVDFFNGEARSPEFRALNEMGEVPVFREGGLTLTQSAVIQLHIAERSGKFLGRDRSEVLRWLMFDNHKLSGQAGSARFLANFLPEAKRPQEVIGFLQSRLRATYKVLNDHLASRDWIVDAAPTIADFACCGYLFYPEPFGFSRAEWPHIDRWLDGIAALPGWKHPYDLMPGNPSDRATKEDA
ncbi:glutathione S-transferase family protein [Paracoccus lutimaris]|uniref:Glutathione S-transferase n=1 Tax=Paracoccus lutimaris TaxID=1490030 RepID=A0A368YZX7_9RHOB|nr:glutathione S-transferase [Paracoccus lutimaris]RCW85753.1 glutathione S-transferase [Paracoccus lutimaris]